MLNKVFVWFIASSKDSEKFSLTVKGLLPFLVLFGVEKEVLDGATNAIVDVVVQGGMFVSGLFALYGFARKIFLSFKS